MCKKKADFEMNEKAPRKVEFGEGGAIGVCELQHTCWLDSFRNWPCEAQFPAGRKAHNHAYPVSIALTRGKKK